MYTVVGSVSRKTETDYVWKFGNVRSIFDLNCCNFRSEDFSGPYCLTTWCFYLDRTRQEVSICVRETPRLFCLDVSLMVQNSRGKRAFISTENVKRRKISTFLGYDEYILGKIEERYPEVIRCTFSRISAEAIGSITLLNGEKGNTDESQTIKGKNTVETSVATRKNAVTATKGLIALSSNLKHLFLSEEDSDVTIKVGDYSYPVHRAILRARSPVFQAMLKHDMVEKANGVVNITDCDPYNFKDFLIYLYTGNLDNISDVNVFDLFQMSDKYDIKELKQDCVEFIQQNLNVESIGDVISLATRHGESEMLQRATEFLICNAK